MSEHHHKPSKATFIRLGILLALGVIGLLTHFKITVNHNTIKEPQAQAATIVRVHKAPDGKLTQAQCYGIKKGMVEDQLIATFGIPADHGWDHDLGFLTYPLRGRKNFTCELSLGTKHRVYEVQLDLVNDGSLGF